MPCPVLALLILFCPIAAAAGEPSIPLPPPPAIRVLPTPVPVPIVPPPAPGTTLSPDEQLRLEARRREVDRLLLQQDRRVPMGAQDLRTLDDLKAARDRLDRAQGR